MSFFHVEREYMAVQGIKLQVSAVAEREMLKTIERDQADKQKHGAHIMHPCDNCYGEPEPGSPTWPVGHYRDFDNDTRALRELFGRYTEVRSTTHHEKRYIIVFKKNGKRMPLYNLCWRHSGDAEAFRDRLNEFYVSNQDKGANRL